MGIIGIGWFRGIGIFAANGKGCPVSAPFLGGQLRVFSSYISGKGSFQICSKPCPFKVISYSILQVRALESIS